MINLFKKVTALVTSNPTLALILAGLVVGAISIPVITLNVTSVREQRSQAAACTVSYTFSWPYYVDWNEVSHGISWGPTSVSPNDWSWTFLPIGATSYTASGLQPDTNYGWKAWVALSYTAGDDYAIISGTVRTPACPSTINPPSVTDVNFLRCESNRPVMLFRWKPGSTSDGRGPDAQFLDLSLSNNGWVDGTYVTASDPPYGGTANPPTASSSYSSATGNDIGPLDPGKRHYWRITNYFNGLANPWGVSGTGVFDTPPTSTCAATPPSVDIVGPQSNQGPLQIAYNTSVDLNWVSFDADSCTVSPDGWTGTSGNRNTGNLTSSKTYTATCNGPGGTKSDSITVNVNQPSCNKPTAPTNLSVGTSPVSKPFTFTWSPGQSQGSAVKWHWVDV
ncbi:MAG TPA: hypothetical protein VIH52_02585, partial [Candidatus Nanoarchaeia archaeon]